MQYWIVKENSREYTVRCGLNGGVCGWYPSKHAALRAIDLIYASKSA
jgi:hypothetical protein